MLRASKSSDNSPVPSSQFPVPGSQSQPPASSLGRYTEPTILRTLRSHVLESPDLAQRIADVLSDRQAEDIVLMDISKVSTFTDYFVVATATNPRQMNALIDSLDRELRDDGIKARRVEGTADSGWVLLDFGDALVHLFAPEERGYYNLEGLWAKGVSVVHMQ